MSIEAGQVGRFMQNENTEFSGEITRVWSKPTPDNPYVTIKTLEDKPRTFVRFASNVMLITEPPEMTG